MSAYHTTPSFAAADASVRSLRSGAIDELVWDRSVRRRLGGIYIGAAGAEPDDGSLMYETVGPAVAMKTVSLATGQAARLSVVRAVNALAAAGTMPEIIELSVLLPIGTKEQNLRDMADEIAGAAAEARVMVSDVCAEVTSAVNRPVVTTTAVGRLRYPGIVSGRPPAGTQILALGKAGLGGTALLARDRAEELTQRFPRQWIARAAALRQQMWLPEVVRVLSGVLEENGLRHCCTVEASEGGVYAAIRRLSKETGRGLEISLPDIPILQETIEIADFYDINPYQMASDGCMLTAIGPGTDERVPGSAGEGFGSIREAEHICRQLTEKGIAARRIGQLIPGREQVLINGDERQYLNRPPADALIEVLN